MRAEIVHITDHALLRWSQRVSRETANVFEIKNAIQKSKVIKKCEPLPYPLPRLDGSVYSIYENIMFVMEPVTINEYRLVTVVAEFISARPPRKRSREKIHEQKQEKTLKKKRVNLARKLDKKEKENERPDRPSRNRPKARPIHVQSVISRLPNLASEGDANLQPTLEQDSAA